MTVNSSANFTDYKTRLSSVYSKFVALSIPLLVCIIFGNVFVLVGAARNKQLRKKGRCYIVSLAIADLLVGLVVYPIRIYQFDNLRPFGEVFCKVYIGLVILCATLSITTLTVISIDRCYKIVYPFDYKSNVTTRKCFIIILFVWIYSITFSALGLVKYNDHTKIYATVYGECASTNHVFYVTAFVVVYCIPCVILVITYSVIFMVARRRRRTWSQGSDQIFPNTECRSTFHKDLKNAKTLGMVVVAFIVCWGPLLILLAFQRYLPQLSRVCSNAYVCTIIIIIFPYANSFCNPLIYALCDKKYWQAVRGIFRKGTTKLPRLAAHSSSTNLKVTLL